MGLNQNVLSRNVCFYKYAHNSAPRGSPDMILIAFDMKFNEKNDEIPPTVSRPSKKSNKNNVEKVNPKKVEKTTMSTKWTPNKNRQKNDVEKEDPPKHA